MCCAAQGKLAVRPKPPRAKAARGKPQPKPPRTPQTVIEDKAHAYLQENAGYLTEESAAALLAGLKPFKLTVREQLQLVNLGPTNAIDIHLVRTHPPHPLSRVLGADRPARALNDTGPKASERARPRVHTERSGYGRQD